MVGLFLTVYLKGGFYLWVLILALLADWKKKMLNFVPAKIITRMLYAQSANLRYLHKTGWTIVPINKWVQR